MGREGGKIQGEEWEVQTAGCKIDYKDASLYNTKNIANICG